MVIPPRPPHALLGMLLWRTALLVLGCCCRDAGALRLLALHALLVLLLPRLVLCGDRGGGCLGANGGWVARSLGGTTQLPIEAATYTAIGSTRRFRH